MLHMLEIVWCRNFKYWLWFIFTTFKCRSEELGDPSEHRWLLWFLSIESNFTHREERVRSVKNKSVAKYRETTFEACFAAKQHSRQGVCPVSLACPIEFDPHLREPCVRFVGGIPSHRFPNAVLIRKRLA